MREIEHNGKKVIVPASPIKSPNTSLTDLLSTIGGILTGPVSPPIGSILAGSVSPSPSIQNNSANKSGDKK